MKLKTKLAQTGSNQTTVHNVESSHLFGDNKTLLPADKLWAIKLVIVCDFPVPGGPSSTRL